MQSWCHQICPFKPFTACELDWLSLIPPSVVPAGDPVPFALTPKVTNERSLDAAVKYASEFLNKAVKPVLVGGVKMRWPAKAQDAFLKLSEAGKGRTSASCRRNRSAN